MLLAAAGAAWSAAPSSPSAAQADTARPRAGLDEPRAFDLPPGPLSAALSQVASDAGVLFSVDLRLIGDRRQPGLRGRLTAREALRQLLRDSGLALVQDGAVLTLRPDATPTGSTEHAPPPPVTLPEVRIRSSAGGDDTYRTPSAQQATRTETPLLELPQSVSVLSRDFIRDQAPQSMADLLRYAPGLGAAQGEGNRDTPVFRGTPSTSDFLLDGLRDDVQYYRDVYNIEQVEVLRGPNAMAVGHGAVGGLINRITKQPRWRDEDELTLETGRWRHGRVTLDADHLLAPTLAARLNLMTEDSGGYRDGFHLRRDGVNPVLAWRPAAATLLTVGYEHFQDRRTADRGIPAWQGRPVDVDPARFFGNPDVSTTWIRLNALTAQLDAELQPGLSLQHKFRLADYDKFFQNAFPGSVRPNASTGALEVALVAHNSRMRRQNVFHQTDLTWTRQLAGIEHRFLAGVEIGHQQGDNRRETGYFATTPESTSLWVPLTDSVSRVPLSFRRRATDPDNASEVHVVAAYWQDQLRLSPRWQATVGLRHDRIRVDVDDHQLGQRLRSQDRLWSPRIGLLHQPTAALSIYANYSLGYALRAGDQLNVLSPGTQSLSPERFQNWEGGVKWAPSTGLDLSAALYQLDRQNVAVADPSAPTQALLLVDGQRTRGLELGAAGRVGAGWQVMAAYTLQRSRVRASLSPLAPAGATMPHVPRHNLSIWSRWTLTPQWSAGLGVQARSSQFTSTDDTVRLPGHARLDAALYYAPAPAWRWQLNVENLLDRRYYAFAHSNNNITPGSPLGVRLGLQLKF